MMLSRHTLERHLVIMAKLPRAGRVKTRLARDIGMAEAVRVYRTVLSETLRGVVAPGRWTTWVAAAPDTAVADPYWPSGTLIRPQGPGDLGQRLQRQFDELPPGPALIVGSDIPGITWNDIADGFKALGANDVVFGPAPDGGYWLVGARRRPRIPKLFANVRWSGPHALADTRQNARHLSVGQLRQIADVDDAASYRAWRAAR